MNAGRFQSPRLRRAGLALVSMVLLSALLSACAGEKKKGTSCASDADCERGSVCDVDSQACAQIACAAIGDCPGSRRTCLEETLTCSAQECAACPDDASSLCCAAAGQTCILEGPHRFSCTGDVACTEDLECGALGQGYTCCNGACALSCGQSDADTIPGSDASVIPGGDQGPQGGDSGGGGMMTGADMGEGPPPGDVHICSECMDDADCASLGEGAECKSIDVGKYCTRPCMGDGDCPAPFICKAGVDLCLPTRVLCGCFATGCEAGQVCDPTTSQCTVPKAACSPCAQDSECADGLKCGTVGAAKFCLPECGGACAAGTTCDAASDTCVPDSGSCDACLGACVGDTPVCIAGEDGRPSNCRACGNGHPCADAMLRCSEENTCVPPGPDMGCVTDNDCVGGRCVAGQCHDCIEDRDCGVRRACNPNTFTCEDNPCGGVVCQGGLGCDPATGRCNGGCNLDADCGDAAALFCDVQTGQCYNRDGSCDDMTAVCPAGSQCQTLIPLPGFPGNCTCIISDPANMALAFCSAGDVVACPPGLICSYFALPGQPAPANGTCGADILMFCP